MATVSQLVEMIAVVTRADSKTVNAYARALLNAGTLPKSSGRAVANVTPEHASKLLLAIAFKPKIKVVAEIVELYCRLEAHTNLGPLTALSVLQDLFGAASAGGIKDHEWTDVSITVFGDKLGVDVRLPASRHGKKADRQVQFRLSRAAAIDDLSRFALSPSPLFYRSANINFGALTLICELMEVRQPISTPKGEEAVGRLLSIEQSPNQDEIYAGARQVPKVGSP